MGRSEVYQESIREERFSRAVDRTRRRAKKVDDEGMRVEIDRIQVGNGGGMWRVL